MSMNLTAALLGIVIGGVAALVWQTVSARMPPIKFWRSFARLTGALFSVGDEREFLRRYVQLLKMLGWYVGRNIILMGASSLPVVFCTRCLGAIAGGHATDGDSLHFWPLPSGLERSFYAAVIVAGLAMMLMFSSRRR